MARVIMIEEARNLDMSAALKWGEATVLFGQDDRRPSILKVNAFADSIRRRLREVNYDPHADLVCVFGSVLKMAILMHVLGADYRRYKLLVFVPSDDRYVVRQMGDVDAEETRDEEVERRGNCVVSDGKRLLSRAPRARGAAQEGSQGRNDRDGTTG